MPLAFSASRTPKKTLFPRRVEFLISVFVESRGALAYSGEVLRLGLDGLWGRIMEKQGNGLGIMVHPPMTMRVPSQPSHSDPETARRPRRGVLSVRLEERNPGTGHASTVVPRKNKRRTK